MPSHEAKQKVHPYPFDTDLAVALNKVGDKWMLPIVEFLIKHGPTRFIEIQRGLTVEKKVNGQTVEKGISTEQCRTVLNKLVADKILDRTRYREVPPRVDYSLTPLGEELYIAIGALRNWGEKSR